jgi:hypothetical protein
MYVTHRQVCDRLLAIPAGRGALLAGVPVERLPDGPGRAPRGGTYRVNQGEEMLLLRAVDELARLAGLEPWAGGGCDDDDS